ncbi:MAG: 4Fe-4S dicluster domain-containing protein [Dysgonamonadaceae bacterium]|jgi:ferredoxin|nr:4Fe-4S dicluster domain-containing protein [Dysgonamonadaceae bacterium]
MQSNALKIVRRVLAAVVFVLIALFFCDFTHRLPLFWHGLMHIQLVPAVLAGSLGILIFLFLLAGLFGRIYCSVICPMGILQDIISFFTRRGKKKNRKKRWYHYTKPYNTVRYGLLTACVIFLILGISTPLLYLDPYSNFGRIAVNLFRPVAIGGNNVLNWIALQFNNYNFYQITIHTVTTASLLIAFIALLAVGILAILRGRLFCNLICPVGSFLGLISRFSIFRVTIDSTKCNHCGLCAKACKSECINSSEGKIDYSRCVVCFNCLDRCNKQALSYKPFFALPQSQSESGEKKGMSRRKFIATSTTIAATVPLIPAWAQSNKPVDVTKLTPVTPPGSKSLKHFKEKCTACHLCVTHCPMQILKPAGFNFGLSYAFKPHLVFYENAFCNYNCTICTQVCPNGAIEPLELSEKQITQIGIAQFEQNLCVVYTDNTSCGACAEHCPVKAVRMEPYKGSLTLPHLYPELCVGCGGCESICPVRPIRAINVMPSAVHGHALPPQEEEVEQINAEELDFGF